MKKQKNFKSKLSNLIINIKKRSFLAWNDPYENIREWFWHQEDAETGLSRTYCRLVINREQLLYSGWASTPQQGYKMLDSALRGGGVIWRKKYFPFGKLPKEVRATLREEWHNTWRVVEIG